MGGGHPFHKTRSEKLNSLQRMAYLLMHLLFAPLIWVSGLLLLFYTSWSIIGLNGFSLETVSYVHTGAAFAILTLLIAHLYLALTMSNNFADLKAMITGYQEE